MRLDFTLTLPGMFDLKNIENLARDLNVELLAKVIFSFSPEVILSPLSLPRHILTPWLDEIESTLSNVVILDLLAQIRTRQTFQEQWPDQYQAALSKGKARVLRLEQIRTQSITMREILSTRPEILEWWDKIENS
jgi:hypothetical protein